MVFLPDLLAGLEGDATVRVDFGGISVHHHLGVVFGSEADGMVDQSIDLVLDQDRDQDRDQVRFLPEEAHLDVVEEAALQEEVEQEDPSLAAVHLAAVLLAEVSPLVEAANLSAEEILLVAEAEEEALPEVEAPEDVNDIKTFKVFTLKVFLYINLQVFALKHPLYYLYS